MDIVKSLKNVRRQVAGFSLAALVASFFAIGVAQAQTFPDVQVSDWFYPYVEDLYSQGIVTGNADGTYAPGANANRAEMAALGVRAFELEGEAATEAPFLDVPMGVWYTDWVFWAKQAGLVDGKKDNNGDLTGMYDPAGNVTRAEAMKILVEAADLTATCPSPFPDTANHWAAGADQYIQKAYANGLIDGYPDGTFQPDSPINRAEIAKVVSNAMNPVIRPCAGFSLASAEAMSATTVEACFNEEHGDGALDAENYMIEDQNGTELDVTAVAASSDPMCVELTTAAQDSTKVYDLTAMNVMSSEGEELIGTMATFDGFSAVEAGGLTVSLDGSSPEDTVIPRNAANVLYSVFNFAADDNEDVEINQLTLLRSGQGSPDDIDKVRLYVNGVEKGGQKTVSSSDNTAVFNLDSDPIVVPAGSSTLVEVRANMTGQENSYNKFCIQTSDDVMAEGVDSGEEVAVGGSFAVCGNTMNTSSAVVGTYTYTVSQTSTADINFGDQDVIMTRVQIDATDEDTWLDKVIFKQQGSADAEDFANETLYYSGSPLDVEGMWEGDLLTFDLTELEPRFEIEDGETVSLELHVDVVGGLGQDAGFDIYRDWHIEGTGQVQGFGVNVEEDGASITPADREIVGGNIAFSLSSDNPIVGDVARGAKDHEFLSFNVATAGEGVTVQKITLQVQTTGGNTADINDLKIWRVNEDDSMSIVAGPDDIDAFATDIEFTDTFDIPGGVTTEFVVTADVANGASNGDIFSVDLMDVTDPSQTELEWTTDGDPVDEATEVSGGTLLGNDQTVADATVTVSLAATPGNKSYVKNTTERDLAAFDFSASTAQDIQLTTVTVHCAVGTGTDCSDAFQNMRLFLKDGSTLTQLDGPDSLSSAGTDGDVTFGLNPPHAIEAGNNARLLMRGDVASAAGAGTYLFTIEAGDVLADAGEIDEQGGFNPAGAAPTVLGLPTGARTITVAGNGALSNQSVSDTATVSRILVDGELKEPVLKLRFAADELEAWNIRKLQIKEINWGNDADVAQVYLKWADKEVSTNLSGGLANFNLATGINVPAGGSVTVEVLVDVGDVSPDNALTGDLPQFAFDWDTNFEAVGASSSTLLTTAPSGADINGELMRIAQSAPSVAHQATSTSLASGTVTLYKWTVTADEANDIAIKQFAFNVNNDVQLDDFKFFRNNVDVSSASATIDVEQLGVGNVEAATIAASANPTILVKWSDATGAGEEIIGAGDTVTYELRAVATTTAAVESISTQLLNDTAGDVGYIATATGGDAPGESVEVNANGGSNFVWSDLSNTVQGGGTAIHNATLDPSGAQAASSFDWVDGFLVDGLSSLNSQVLSD